MKKSIKAFLAAFVFTLIPLTAFIGVGAAYSNVADRKDGIGGWVKLGFKIIIVQLLYAAPAIAVYAFYSLLATYYYLSYGIQLILLYVLILFSARALLLIPVASCALAMGAPIKVAVNGKEMNSIISGSFWRYIFSGIVCLLLIVVIDIPMLWEWSLLLQYVVASLLEVLYQFVSAGLFAKVVRRSLGIEPPLGPNSGNGRTVAGAVVAVGMCILIFAQSSLSVIAYGRYDEDIKPVRPPGSEGSELFTEENLYRYYHAPEIDNGLPSAGTVYDVAGDICNVTPGISNVKNGIQAAGYYVLGAITNNEEQRQYYHSNAVYKAVGIITGPMDSWGAKALQAYDSAMSWLGFSDDLAGTKTDEAFGPATIVQGVANLTNRALEEASEAFRKADVAITNLVEYTYKETCKQVSLTAEGLDEQYGISDAADWWLTVPQPLPGQSHIWINDPDHPLETSVDDYWHTVSDGSLNLGELDDQPRLNLPGINSGGGPLHEFDPDSGKKRRDDSHLPKLDGSYSGQQITPTIPSIEGLTYDIVPNKVYIDIYDDNTASFSTVVETQFDYDLMGYAQESGSAVATVKCSDIQLIALDGSESDGYIPMFRGEFTVRATSYMDVTLSGIAYGNETYTSSAEQEADYSVVFILGYCDGEPQIWGGEISCKPVGVSDGADVSMIDATIEFKCY